MPALGIAMLLNYLGKKTLIPWFFGGFFLTVYSGLGLTAVSIFSAIIALILYLNQGKSAEQTEKKKVKRLSLNKTVEVKEAGAPAGGPGAHRGCSYHDLKQRQEGVPDRQIPGHSICAWPADRRQHRCEGGGGRWQARLMWPS